jgi:hypoxanthine phosphoribosyltransferase
MQIKDKKFELFINQQQIQKRVQELGVVISKDYQNQDPLFLPLLNGAFLFAADLIKEITVDCQVSFIKASSYCGTESSGKVQKVFGLDIDIQGRNVILVDDIVDTGLTMDCIIEEIKLLNPKSIEIASFLIKPEALQKPLEVKYVGFTIPTHFVVGYGLDYDGYGRNLKDIYQLKS